MVIESTAPTRIDLAGGAFDVYPLYLFEGGGVTVNMAITLLNKVRLETREDKEIHLHSIDLMVKEEAKDVDSLNLESELGFVARIIKFYRPKTGLNVTTKNTIPKGSGLGTSSSLLIALSGALNELNKTGVSAEQFIDYGANIEAQSLKVPTGKQDYYAAVYGGVNAIWSELKGCRLEKIPFDDESIEEFNQRIILSFTGKPRFSGATNWNLVKGYIDGVGNTRQHLLGIKATGLKMRECLLARDMEKFAILLREEWENRKRCAEGVTTTQIDKIIAEAKKNGALASKLCGAGGGGCMITYVKKGDREKIKNVLQSLGAKYMDARIAKQGLTITTQ
ncbi:hypothetical protein AUJ66_04835 [Candidatus Desantisbacteria bacterium CG1_02_38_46]|uniref:GHMP kinase n=3 Tax=unclassified Candidatus Desantisiibacteriota TaxID=3106372 RepID=A0A2H9PBZ6_9BACT|nr:MAG: hypothetical protein AUJ66_04835 [Candidatus Desantisbacteria bacterium CG1_02_38_46]PIU50892.1 MAG: GHMP kinase [Candidatus Desantisbacteria bacterium CG07_land_8_20_14_0_80_39_15]PIZ15630.1 MAG: GHMP kinase [Candidatus Desantisbacteria bacterium CG_4_10_14_0_8_um_filter_39_17]